MKGNHRPQKDRILGRLLKLNQRYPKDYPNEPIGGGNPYYRCSFCGRSDPEINMREEGHSQGCEWVSGRRETRHYLRLLKEECDLELTERELERI